MLNNVLMICLYIIFIYYDQHIKYLHGKMRDIFYKIPDSKDHGANMGPTWDLSAPDGPHVGPMNLAIRDIMYI